MGEGRTNMKTVKVKINASDDGAGGFDFDVDEIKPPQAHLKLDKDSGTHLIAFELHDHSSGKLKFDSRDPIWVGEDCPCPPAQGINTDQVELGDCGTQSLQIINGNWGRERELRYQPNFVANDGSPRNCDPVIQNGGGIKS